MSENQADSTAILSVAAQSREVVRMLSEYTGRGPTRARGHINEAIRMVERRSGRVVSAFLSANQLEPDVCIESFVLEPDRSYKSTAPPETESP